MSFVDAGRISFVTHTYTRNIVCQVANKIKLLFLKKSFVLRFDCVVLRKLFEN